MITVCWDRIIPNPPLLLPFDIEINLPFPDDNIGLFIISIIVTSPAVIIILFHLILIYHND